MAEERGTRLIAVCWSLVAASAVMLFLRVYCKLWRRRGLWWDDHFLIISWLSLVIAVSLNTYIVSLGFGSHIWTISDENLKKINLDTIIVAAFGIISTTTGKTSFAITLYRITETKWMKWFLIFVIITVNLFLNFVWIFGLAKCTPFARVYDKSVPGTCWDLQRLAKFQLFAAYYSAILDFVLAFLPWQVLMGLNMKLREKIGVAVAMSLGAVAGATGIVKAVLVVSMTDPDVTYQRVDLTIWTLSEPAVTIMAICIPVLRSLYREIKTSSQRSNTYRDKSRLTSNEPHTGTHGSSADARKSSRVLGFSAKYGREHVNVMSTSDFRESQEALKDVESSLSEHDVGSGGIVKTEEYRVRMERVSSEERGFPSHPPLGDVEMVPMGRGHHAR